MSEWAAGLFEGEGAVTVCRGRRRLQIKMVERSSLERFAMETQAGVIYGPYVNRMGEKDGYARSDVYLWVAELDDADRVAAMLFPHLTEWRRAKLYEAFPDVVGEAPGTCQRPPVASCAA